MKYQKYALYCLFIEDVIIQIKDSLIAMSDIKVLDIILKSIISLFLILAIIYFIISLTNKSIRIKDNYSNSFLIIVFILMMMSLVSIFKTIINTSDPYLDSIGNRYITLFLNPICTPFVIVPIFILGYSLINRQYIKLSLTLLIVSAFTAKSLELLCAIPFFIYCKRKTKGIIAIFIIVAILECMFTALVSNGIEAGGGTTRSNLIIVFISVSAILYRKFLGHSRKVLYLYFGCVIVYIVFSIYSAFQGESVFESIMEFIGQEDTFADSNDTRSFLYLELWDDLIKDNSLIFGKGAYSHYFSPYFLQSNDQFGDFYIRIGTEVYWLNLIQKCGLLYFILLVAVYLKGIYNAIAHGNSTFIRTIAVILIGWFVYAFVSFSNTVSFADISIFVFLGLCHSKYWLSKKDNEIKKMLTSHY